MEELEDNQRVLRERRFDLDEQFANLATGCGFELSPRPERFEFIVSPDGKAILIECPEPIDWTRIGATALTTEAGPSMTTKLLYSSDFTRAILYLPSAVAGIYRLVVTYLPSLPAHLNWLTGWLDHRREEYTLTLEIPSEIR
ncbi:MAG: hypothetical protein IPG76_00155 [Acidobacteria bacterium]|nr:hypothetical protein [Acidobacteriota bacterium]